MGRVVAIGRMSGGRDWLYYRLRKKIVAHHVPPLVSHDSFSPGKICFCAPPNCHD